MLRELLDTSPLTNEDEIEAFVSLRQMVTEIGAIHLILNCVSIFTHENSKIAPGPELADTLEKPSVAEAQVTSNDKSQVYWEKGTGYGTGSRQQSWNAEQAFKRQKSDEDCVTVLLQVRNCFDHFRFSQIESTHPTDIVKLCQPWRFNVGRWDLRSAASVQLFARRFLPSTGAVVLSSQ